MFVLLPLLLPRLFVLWALQLALPFYPCVFLARLYVVTNSLMHQVKEHHTNRVRVGTPGDVDGNVFV